MNEPRLEVAADGSIELIGELNHQNVPSLLRKSDDMIVNNDTNQSSNLVINLNAVSRSDSAGVALLIEWTRQAKQFQKHIRFNNIPQQMHEIAEVTGVDKMLAK